MQELTHNDWTNREKIINHLKTPKIWVYDMHEQDKMTTQDNCELDVQHQDITLYRKFIQNKSFNGVHVHNQTQANNNLLMVPYDHA